MFVPQELDGVVVSTEDTLSGTLRFEGTRVPVQALLDTLLRGESIEYFLDDFPDVTRDQAMVVIAWEQNQSRKILGLDPVKV